MFRASLIAECLVSEVGFHLTFSKQTDVALSAPSTVSFSSTNIPCILETTRIMRNSYFLDPPSTLQIAHMPLLQTICTCLRVQRGSRFSHQQSEAIMREGLPQNFHAACRVFTITCRMPQYWFLWVPGIVMYAPEYLGYHPKGTVLKPTFISPEGFLQKPSCMHGHRT